MKKADLTKLQDQLYALEERLLHPDRETDRNVLIPLLAPDFKEFCNSGRIMNRQQTAEAILASTPRTATIHHFLIAPLGEDTMLATYRLTTALAVSHRSSIWMRRNGEWQLFFHQGTPAV